MKCRTSLFIWFLGFMNGADTGTLAIRLLGLADGLEFPRIQGRI